MECSLSKQRFGWRFPKCFCGNSKSEGNDEMIFEWRFIHKLRIICWNLCLPVLPKRPPIFLVYKGKGSSVLVCQVCLDQLEIKDGRGNLVTSTGTDCRIVWMQDIFSLVKLHMCYMFIEFVWVVFFNDLNLKKCFLNFQDDVFSSERPGFYFYFHAYYHMWETKKLVLKIQVLSHRHDHMFNGSHPSSNAVHFPRG